MNFTGRVYGLVGALFLAPTSYALSVENALALFDHGVRNYNVITSGNANLQFLNNDTEGPLAVGGNLVIGGVPLVNLGEFNASSDPTLYVGGTFSVYNNGLVQLNNGYAALPGMAGNGTFHSDVKRYELPGGAGALRINSNTSFSSTDPRTNPIPLGWNFSSLFDDFHAASASLAHANATGNITANNNQLKFNGQATGVTIFNLDLSLLAGNTFDGAVFSSIDMNIGTDAIFVVNLLNAAGRTLFGNGGVNFNLSNDMAGRLLWNIVGTDIDVSLGNGGQFYGSILAPDVNLSNAFNAPIKGQIVAETLTYTNAEIHFAGFSPPVAVPEASTSLFLCGSGVLVGLMVFRRHRKKSKALQSV